MEVNIQNKKDVLSTLEKGRKVEGRLWMELKEEECKMSEELRAMYEEEFGNIYVN